MRVPRTSIFTIDLKFIICLLLILSILAVYGKVRDYEFTNFDDDIYVTSNSFVRSGVNLTSFRWSFSFQQKDKSYWHPLTWLSHMVDVELYGLEPGRHHLTNVLFHTANTLLLFIALNWMTGAMWRSAFAAILFALHPLNVESVAWIAQRKNVLSSFFWMVTLIAYQYYVQRPKFLRYLAVCFAFALGLLAKPMLVTLPFVLLLLDYWPLRRWGPASSDTGTRRNRNTMLLIFEKVPLLVLSALSVYISSKSVQQKGDVISFDLVPMLLRIKNALVSYVMYMGKMVWPQNLSVYYPFPDLVSVDQFVGAAAALMCVSALVIWGLKQGPYLAVGWFWFLGTLVPVIGLVQVGLWPAMADRWAYIPLIGLFIMIAWGIPELIKGWHHKHKILAIAAGAIVLLLSITTQIQIRHWSDSTSLFKQAVKAATGSSTPRNKLGSAFIYDKLAMALMKEGRTDEALHSLVAAVDLSPDSPRVNNDLGIILLQKGEIDEAIGYFSRAVELNSAYSFAHYNLATALIQSEKFDEAISHYLIALKLAPNNKETLNDLANLLVARGRNNEALSYYAKALDLDPRDAEVHNNMGVAMIHAGKIREAVHHFRIALQLNPEYADAQKNLDHVLAGYR
jgi:Tfp pilus assembly protein PilF